MKNKGYDIVLYKFKSNITYGLTLCDEGGLMCPYIDRSVGHNSPAYFIDINNLQQYREIVESMRQENSN